MENLVDKIIEIDKIAEQRIQQAEQKQKEKMADIDLQKKEIVEQLKEKSKQKLADYEKAQQAETAEQIKEVQNQQRLVAQALKDLATKKHDDWVEDLVRRTLQQ